MAQVIPTIRKVEWQDIRSQTHKANSRLATLIDEFDPNSEYELFLVRYPYGAHIVDKGTLIVPSPEGRLLPITDSKIDANVRAALGYTSIPLGLWLNTAAEVYVETDERVVPLHIFQPGDFFGLWEALDPPTSAFVERIWSIAVGSRSLFMLPKITDTTCHTRLQRNFGLRTTQPPRTLFDQSQLFSQITNSKICQTEWCSEVLLFSGKWMQEQTDNKAWLKLHYYLLKQEWLQSIYWRNKVTFELIGQAFAAAQESRNLKSNPYLIDTAMYLISLGTGSSPGFAPAINDETVGPISAIQAAYLDAYGLKSYIPTIMRPQYLQKGEPIYYSMQSPTVLATSPKSKKPHSFVDDQRTVMLLLETLHQKLKSDNTPFYNIIEHLQFEFFHCEAVPNDDIRPTAEMPAGDPRLITFACSPEDKRIFCETGPFIRGCIRISRKE